MDVIDFLSNWSDDLDIRYAECMKIIEHPSISAKVKLVYYQELSHIKFMQSQLRTALELNRTKI